MLIIFWKFSQHMVVLSFVHLVLMGNYPFFPLVSQSCYWCPNNYWLANHVIGAPIIIGIIGIIASIFPSIIGIINSKYYQYVHCYESIFPVLFFIRVVPTISIILPWLFHDYFPCLIPIIVSYSLLPITINRVYYSLLLVIVFPIVIPLFLVSITMNSSHDSLAIWFVGQRIGYHPIDPGWNGGFEPHGCYSCDSLWSPV